MEDPCHVGGAFLQYFIPSKWDKTDTRDLACSRATDLVSSLVSSHLATNSLDRSLAPASGTQIEAGEVVVCTLDLGVETRTELTYLVKTLIPRQAGLRLRETGSMRCEYGCCFSLPFFIMFLLVLSELGR